MQSQGNAPNKAQKDFRENLRSLYPGSEIHHLYGASAQVKIALVSTNIGHWAIIALDESMHKEIHASAARKGLENMTYILQMRVYVAEHGEVPFSEEIYDAILAYHK